MPKRSQPDLLQGTLDLMILKALSLEPMHGWAISQRISQISTEAFSVNQGSLYPALHRLEEKGWVSSQTGTADNNRTVKVYQLTRSGVAQLTKEKEDWNRLAAAMARLLEAQ